MPNLYELYFFRLNVGAAFLHTGSHIIYDDAYVQVSVCFLIM